MLTIWLTITRILIIGLTIGLAWATWRSHQLLKEYQPDINLLLSIPELLARLGLVGVWFLLAWFSGMSAARLGLHLENFLAYLGWGLVIGVVTISLINLMTGWAIKRFGRGIYSPLVIINILPQRPLEWVLSLPAMLVAVTMEELLFRSLWLGVFAPVVAPMLLVLITSIIFGAMHSPQGSLGMIVAGGMNILLSLLFLWSSSLILPLTVHFTINLLQLVVGHYQRDWLESY